MRSCKLSRTEGPVAVAAGKVCQQPVAGKALGLPVGAAAPSSGVSVTWSGGLLTWRALRVAATKGPSPSAKADECWPLTVGLTVRHRAATPDQVMALTVSQCSSASVNSRTTSSRWTGTSVMARTCRTCA
jgi:hypothetical protein